MRSFTIGGYWITLVLGGRWLLSLKYLNQRAYKIPGERCTVWLSASLGLLAIWMLK